MIDWTKGDRAMEAINGHGFTLEHRDAVRSALRLGATRLSVWVISTNPESYVIVEVTGLSFCGARTDDPTSMRTLADYVLSELRPRVRQPGDAVGVVDGYHADFGTEVRVDSEALSLLRGVLLEASS